MIVTVEIQQLLSTFTQLQDPALAPTMIEGEIVYPDEATAIIEAIQADPNWEQDAAAQQVEIETQAQAAFDQDALVLSKGGTTAALAELIAKDEAQQNQQQVNIQDPAVLAYLKAQGWQGRTPEISRGSPLNFKRSAATYFRINDLNEFETITHDANTDFDYIVATSQGFLDTGFDGTDLSGGVDTYSTGWGYENLATGNVEDFKGFGGDTDDVGRVAVFQNPASGEMAVLLPQRIEANVTTVVNFGFVREYTIPTALEDWKFCAFAIIDEDSAGFSYIYKG